MTVCALETLFQVCVRGWLDGSVTHRQVLATNMPSQLSVSSILVTGSLAEVTIPQRGSSCSELQILWALQLVKDGRIDNKLARSC